MSEFNCAKHHWISTRSICLHCVDDAGGKVLLSTFSTGNHGHIIYTIFEVGKKPYMLEMCMTNAPVKKSCDA